jgi:hypothetical protein
MHQTAYVRAKARFTKAMRQWLPHRNYVSIAETLSLCGLDRLKWLFLHYNYKAHLLRQRPSFCYANLYVPQLTNVIARILTKSVILARLLVTWGTSSFSATKGWTLASKSMEMMVV